MATILIVDDDELMCALVGRVLAAAGHVVIPVLDGSEAYDALWDHAIDLAILDCALPGRPGLSIMADIRKSEIFHRLPVLVLTARRSEWHEKLAIEAGADEYLRKPFEPDALIAAVERLLSHAKVSQ